jgi:hypothetical protein
MRDRAFKTDLKHEKMRRGGSYFKQSTASASFYVSDNNRLRAKSLFIESATRIPTSPGMEDLVASDSLFTASIDYTETETLQKSQDVHAPSHDSTDAPKSTAVPTAAWNKFGKSGYEGVRSWSRRF